MSATTTEPLATSADVRASRELYGQLPQEARARIANFAIRGLNELESQLRRQLFRANGTFIEPIGESGTDPLRALSADVFANLDGNTGARHSGTTKHNTTKQHSVIPNNLLKQSTFSSHSTAASW